MSLKDSRGTQVLPLGVSTTLFYKYIFMCKFLNKKRKNDKFISELHCTAAIKIIFEIRRQKYTIINERWLVDLVIRSGDVEVNPGPTKMTLVTLNCRGLKNKEKFTQLFNRLNTFHSEPNTIIALQETHLEFNNLNYKWRGNHIFTEGRGAQGG